MWGVDTTKPGSQAYYDSIAELYASWGVDFIKADDMGSHLYQPAEIKALALAIRKTGRPMLLSISPGPAPHAATEAKVGTTLSGRGVSVPSLTKASSFSSMGSAPSPMP